MAGVGRRSGYCIAAIIFLFQSATSAPVTEENTSQALQLSELNGNGRGCYYNFEHYDEGDRILTNEPCLNCTCHNRMLMCYLRVCPFTKAIGQDCTVEKKPDQCCPVITCLQVPVALLTSSTTSETPPTTTALGRPDNYGCILEDNTFYPDGAQVPSDPRKPCELCYCIRNHTACVMQECTLNVEGCRPVYQVGVCCPVRYECDYDEVSTTPKPLGLVTTPGGSSDCLHNGIVYHDGAMVEKDEKAPCEHCYCMRGDIVCAVQECGTPLEGRDCTPMEPTPGQCCPNYQCANGTYTSEATPQYFGSTEKITEAIKEQTNEEDKEKQDSNESSNESNESSEEIKPVSSDSDHSSTEGDHSGEEEDTHNEEHHTEAPEQSLSSENAVVTESSIHSTEGLNQAGSSDEAAQTPKPEGTHDIEQTNDSESEASQQQVLETQAPHESSHNSQATNEIPESTTFEHNAPTTTEEPIVETSRIPGEGSCLVDGKTYSHNTIIPTANPCQEVCRCFSSIVSCKPRDCPPAPSADENCMPVMTPGSCCPTYMCDQKTSDAPESEDHKIDSVSEEDSSQAHVESATVQLEEQQATEVPIIDSIPPNHLSQGSNVPLDQSHPAAVDEAAVDEAAVHEAAVDEAAVSDNKEESPLGIDENGHLSPQIVHEMNTALHGGQSDNIDANENGKLPLPVGDVSTVGPVNEDVAPEEEQPVEEGFNSVTTSSTDVSEGNTAGVHTSEHPFQTDAHAESTLMGQEEGSGQESTNELSNIHEVSTSDEISQQPTVGPISVDDVHSSQSPQEPSETIPEDSLHSASHDVSSASQPEEHVTEVPTKEEYGTEAPTNEEIGMGVQTNEESESEEPVNEEHGTEAPSNEEHPENTEQSAQETLNQNLPTEVHGDETHSDNQDPQEVSVQEATTIPGIIPDDSHQAEVSIPEDSQKEQTVSQVTEETPSENVNEDHQPDNLFETTIAPVENHEEIQTPTKEEGSQGSIQDSQSSTKPPSDKIPEQPITDNPIVDEVNTLAPVSDSVNQDSVPDSTQQNEETSEHHTVNNEEITAQKETEASTESITVSSASPVLSEGNENVEEATDEIKNSDQASEISGQDGALPEKNTEIASEETIQPTLSPMASDNLGTSSKPAPSEVPSNPTDESHIDDSSIVYEVVKVTGMPSIESHVTEGSTDHHQSPPSTPMPETHPFTEGIHIPGPEGIKPDHESEKDHEEEGTAVHPQEPSEHTPTLTQETSETIQPVEVTPTSQGAEETKPPQDANEAGSTLSETIHPGNTQEIINEINEQKESLNQITSDGASQTSDEVNQIIQNEVNNELHPVNIEQSQTEQTAQTEISPGADTHEEKPAEPSAEVSQSNESNQDTTAAPPVALEESTLSSQSLPNENSNNESSQHSEGENVSSDISEENSPQTSVDSSTDSPVKEEVQPPTEEPSPESNVPTSEATATDTSKEGNQKEPTDNKTNEEVEGVNSEVPSEESVGQLPISDSELSITGQEPTGNNETPVATDRPAEESLNNDRISDLTTVKPQNGVEESVKEQAEIQTETGLESSSETSSQEESHVASSGLDQSEVVQNITHVESNVPQVPDSANQLLETIGDVVQTTPQIVEESGNIIVPDNGSQSSHSTVDENPLGQDTSESGDQEKQQEPQPVETPLETSSDHQELPVENQESSTEHQQSSLENIPDENQKVPLVPQVAEEPSSTEHADTQSNNQEIQTDHHEAVGEQDVTVDQVTASIEHANEHETHDEHQQTPVENQETPIEGEQTSTENPETPSGENGLPIKEEGTSTGQEISTEQTADLAEHQEIITERPEIPSEPQLPVDNQEAPAEVSEESSTEQQATPNEPQESEEVQTGHQESTSEHLDTAIEHHEGPVENQDTLPDQQESNSEKQEPSTEQPIIDSEQQESIHEHNEIPSEHEISHQESSPEHEEIITELPEKVTQQNEPTHGPQEESTEHQETNEVHHSGEVQESENTPDHQEPVTDGKETLIEHQEMVTETGSISENIPEEPSKDEHENVPQQPDIGSQDSLPEQPVTVSQEIEAEKHETESQEVPSEQPETVSHETVTERQETVSQENATEQPETVPQEVIPVDQETVSGDTITEQHETESHETAPEQHETESHETAPEQHETESHETAPEQHETESHETAPEQHETVSEETAQEEHETVSEETAPEQHETASEETAPEQHETASEETAPEQHETSSLETAPEQNETVSQETSPEQHETVPQETAPEQHEATSEQHESISETATESGLKETSSEHAEITSAPQEPAEHIEITPDHHETISENSPDAEHTENEHTGVPDVAVSSEASNLDQPSTEGVHSVPNIETSSETQLNVEDESQKQDLPVTHTPQTEISHGEVPQTPEQISEQIQSIVHSTERPNINEALSSTHRPIIEEPSPMFPSWSQKPFEHHTTPEPHTPEENPYPSGYDPEYEDEEGVSYGPGTCRYGGKVYLSAQQIPRDDPCDFCFCFRSDIICLQQSCPPPIRGCYQETIKGFCCPRYECHVSMATMVNVTTTTTTTTTTLPPHFFAHAYNGAATKAGCQVKGVAYNVGERIPSTSGPCLECRCGANGQMKCDPTVCGPQEALLRQVMDAAVSKRRR